MRVVDAHEIARALPRRIVSGGQTGVDRAALDAALYAGIPCGGWCPKGRRAEDGVIALLYPLDETPTDDYAERTLWNARDSDGTLVLTVGEPTGGTALTLDFADQLRRPSLLVDLSLEASVSRARAWIETERIHTLNIAGPRESGVPGIYAKARGFLDKLLQ
ncbi:MAG: hypothetical protein RLZZ303_339 [Candidatus Hydrogenedentota bacterium]|jgi:hypothetical protein